MMEEKRYGGFFGTGGIRGVANVEPMTGEDGNEEGGRAAAYIFKK